MIRLTRVLVLAAFMLPSAALADSMVVGYVSVNQLLEESPQARQADQQLEESLSPAQRELHEKQQRFEALREELERDGLVMAEDEREEIQRELQQLQQELVQGEQVFRQQLEEQRNIALGQVERAVIAAVDEIADEEGFDLVVSQGVLYRSDRIDLTDRVLERMRSHYEAAD